MERVGGVPPRRVHAPVEVRGRELPQMIFPVAHHGWTAGPELRQEMPASPLRFPQTGFFVPLESEYACHSRRGTGTSHNQEHWVLRVDPASLLRHSSLFSRTVLFYFFFAITMILSP